MPTSRRSSLRGIVEESRFHFLKLRMTTTITTKFGSGSFTVRDEIENFSADAGDDADALSHQLRPAAARRRLARGRAGQDAGAADAAGRQRHQVVGQLLRPEPGFDEMVYFFELNAADDGTTRT